MAKNSLFVLGDSISMHYGPYLKKYVEGIFQYDRKRDDSQKAVDLDRPVGANGGDSSLVLDFIKQKGSLLEKTDILLLNCGLHDIKTDINTRQKQVDIDQYKSNIREVVETLSKYAIKVVWVRTTPIDEVMHNEMKAAYFLRFEKDITEYNNSADSLMMEYGVPVIDLFNFTEKLGKNVHYDGVHFKEHIRDLQAAFITGCLMNMFLWPGTAFGLAGKAMASEDSMVGAIEYAVRLANRREA